jgi:hypothetical protein
MEHWNHVNFYEFKIEIPYFAWMQKSLKKRKEKPLQLLVVMMLLSRESYVFFIVFEHIVYDNDMYHKKLYIETL